MSYGWGDYLSFTSNAAPKTKYGVTVVECEFDYEDEEFCTDSRLKSYAKVIKERKPNFDGNKIIYVFETNATGYVNKKPYRLVIIDPAKKTVVPFSYALSAATDGEGKARFHWGMPQNYKLMEHYATGKTPLIISTRNKKHFA